MSPRSVLVVGSGPSGVHFAQSALRRGFAVTMIDVGREGTTPPAPDARFEQVKSRLDDPVRYFLGDGLEGLVLPGNEREFYGFPPSKRYIFDPPPGFEYLAEGFEPLFSFARGGLAEAWTAGCYPFNEAELVQFPFSYRELEPYYDEIARRIGVTGEPDDLAQFMPAHAHLLPGLDLDPHSATLLEAYRRKRGVLNRDLGAFLGRTRVATLSASKAGRQACEYLGRCLWGCPIDALYTPTQTLRELQRDPGFRYVPGVEALCFRIAPGGVAQSLVGRPVGGGGTVEFPVERLVLAAGTLCSATLVLRSVRGATGEDLALRGLMDNRQALVPFLNLRMLGRAVPERSYQYHLLGMGLRTPDPVEYVHCQITTLTTALMHPIIQGLPFDLRTSQLVTRAMRAALGVVNVNFHDRRREENTLSLDGTGAPEDAKLRIRYAPSPDEPQHLRGALGTIRRTLRHLGCFAPTWMQHIRPMGASVHYAGVLPMGRNGGRWSTTPGGRSREFPNLYLADGSTFPFLPAKNLTFTLMANAARIADAMAEEQ